MKQLGEKLLSWASILDDDTREQAERISRLAIVYPHVALMPDAHLGKGATVGSVVPTRKALIPAAVGVDIGCGMHAVRTQLRVHDLPSDLGKLREAIQEAVPVSAGGYNRKLTDMATLRTLELENQARHIGGLDPATYAANWKLQLGSLGSGNHFIELARDEENRMWTFVHSGSRGVGNKIAQHHIKVARKFHEVEGTPLEDPDLAWLPEGTPEFARYVAEMQWAQRFAWFNRQEMTDRVIWCLEMLLNMKIVRQDEVHCHHNYTVLERHKDESLWVTRKGAISAYRGMKGLIPGSMGDVSYVVRGLGNADSLCSAPHGAGRQYSRRKAREAFNVEQFDELMTQRGVEYDRSRAAKFLDEHPHAYKPIDQVMDDANDLVEVVHELQQIVNVKGD